MTLSEKECMRFWAEADYPIGYHAVAKLMRRVHDEAYRAGLEAAAVSCDLCSASARNPIRRVHLGQKGNDDG